MVKKLLLKVFVSCLFFCQFVNKARAQYAIGRATNTSLNAINLTDVKQGINGVAITAPANLVVELKIPTLFSPNGDGVNDEFVIKDLGDYAQNELIVINRWGNEVYRQADYKNNWSGTGLNEGTYFYILRLKKSNGESWLIKKGYVTLIRTFKK